MLDAGSAVESMTPGSAEPESKSGKGLSLAAATAEPSHSAGSLACRARPQSKLIPAVPQQGIAGKEKGPATTQAEVQREAATSVPNAWLQGPPRVASSSKGSSSGQPTGAGNEGYAAE